MIDYEDVYRIGILNKPHGVQGEVLFTFDDDVFDRVDADYLVCDMDGILVPFFLESYRFRSDTTALVKFEDIDSAEQARRFTNITVYFPKDLADEGETTEHNWNFFVGFRIKDVHGGDLGTVTDVDCSTINTLLVVSHDGGELLIPAQEEFITDMDTKGKVITMDLPKGLLEL